MVALNLLEFVGRFSAFALRSLRAAAGAVLHPREVHRQLHSVLLGALPLVLITGLALGAVVWLHLHSLLKRFEATQYLPQALALAVVLEFAPTGTGLIVAGRSGASLGAELGSMRLTEQVDALEVLGLSPWSQLVGPRVLACILALPVLTIFMAYMAILGGYGAETLGGNMSWTEYQTHCLSSLMLQDVVPATLKTLVFGYLIGVTGCYFGLTAEGGTEGVGRAATRGVVLSTFLVVVSNVLLVRAIQVLGFGA
jgi:phospholipid/cholesterol/gamma-HCH transport system permease protein